MANETIEVDLIVEALTKGFDGVQKKLEKLNDESSSDKPSKGAFKWTELASKLSLAESAFSITTGTIQKTWAVLEEGAALDLTRQRFEKLTASVGSGSDEMLAALSEATGGMVSQAEQMESASQIISLGLADNQDDIVDLAGLVSQLGWDMNQVIMTFANNSKMRLDALGLSVQDVEEKMEALEEQGYDTDKAFDLAVIQAGQEKLELLGTAADTTAGGMQRLTARIRDQKNALLELIGTRTSGIFVGLANALDAAEQGHADLKEAYDLGLISYKQYRDGYSDVSWLQDNRGHLEEARIALEEYHGKMDQFNEQQERTRSLYEKQADSANEAADATNAYGWSLDGVRKNYQGLGQAGFEKFGDDLDAQNQALEDGRQKLEDYHRAFAGKFVAALKSGNEEFGAWVTTSTAVGGKTQEQQKNFEDLTREAEKVRAEINSLQGGTAGLGMTTDEINEALGEQYEKLALVEGALGPLSDITTEYTNTGSQWVVNQEAMNEAALDSVIAMGANAKEIALAAYSLGVYDETQLEAALNAAITQEKIDQLSEAFVRGEIDARGLKEGMDQIVADSPYTAQIDAITDQALSKINDVNAKLDALAGKTVTTRVVVEEVGGGTYDPNRPDARAFGGPVLPGGSYIVGERSPELFVPNQAGTIVPLEKVGGGQSISISFAGAIFQGTTQDQANQIVTYVNRELGSLT